MGGLIGGLSLAGCLSRSDEAEELPPIDAEEEELLAVAAIEPPASPELLPIEAAPEYVGSIRERVESLLSALPDDLAASIPNEAVRTHVEEARIEAREHLETSETASSTDRTLSALRSARRQAARAEGIYGVADEGRTREDVFRDADAVRSSLSTVESNLQWTGEDPGRTLLVYETIESHLDRAERVLGEQLDLIAPAASEVEAVGEGAEVVEGARARVEDATHLLERQPTDERFDGTFREVAEALLEPAADRIDDIPAESGELLDLEGGGRRDRFGHLFRPLQRNLEHAHEFLEADRIARGLRQAYLLSIELDTIDRLETRSAAGDLELPESVEGVEAAKREAIEATESTRTEVEHAPFAEYGIDRAVGSISSGDWAIEQIRDRELDLDDSYAMRYVVDAFDGYVLAAEIARAVPKTVEAVAEI